MSEREVNNVVPLSEAQNPVDSTDDALPKAPPVQAPSVPPTRAPQPVPAVESQNLLVTNYQVYLQIIDQDKALAVAYERLAEQARETAKVRLELLGQIFNRERYWLSLHPTGKKLLA